VPDLGLLCDDLAAEQAAVDALVADLDDEGWRRPTPAPGWTIRDQVAHLAFADARTRLALDDPDAFAAVRDADTADRPAFARRMAGSDSGEGPEALALWRSKRDAVVARLREIDPATRVPWYGPSMSPTSIATARLMETWAHGYEIAEAVGAELPVTNRLRHVAHIGVGARRFSFVVNGLEPDDRPVRVELLSPDGAETWTWGDPDAEDVVRGGALDFCLVVTRRRLVGDTALEVRGPAATEWMAIAQAFAGPPGPDPSRPRGAAPRLQR
jgi:uncharacterized protein (TIGR03084 family)